MPTILNGANEVAVTLFLDKKIKFLEIGDIIEETMIKFKEEAEKLELTIDNILAIDEKVREYVRNREK